MGHGSTTLPRITSLTLVNARDNHDMFPLHDGVVLNRQALPPFSICANVEDGTVVGSVLFHVNDRLEKKESFAPYCIAGDARGDYHPWMVFTNGIGGEYEVTATPYSAKKGQGTPGLPVTVTVWIL